MSIKITRTDNGELTTLHIAGTLDLVTAPQLEEYINQIVEDHRMHVTMDLAGLDQIDSSGVAELVGLTKRVRRYGGDVLLTGAEGQPEAIFKLLRFDKLWPTK
jgi:anti-sigma B factor antagonist